MLAVGLLSGRPEAVFDVRDYVAADSRFVASLDMERAAFSHSGEPNFLLVEGPLDDDEALRRLGQLQAAIREAGLALIYVGIESGDDEVLQMVKKGETFATSVKGLQRSKKAGIKSSVMILNGLGGKKYSEQHALN